MTKKAYLLPLFPAICILILICVESCSQHRKGGIIGRSLEKDFSTSPVLSAKESIKTMRLEKGFSIHIVAEEPMVNSPVAMTFDNKGRIWVVEMESFMPDTSGTGEGRPNGKIAILSDKNGDGLMDNRKIFLDSLVLPRAICLIENGVLVAESPKLWFYEILNDKPVKKILVDSAYAEGGNVEHQPNGLFRAMDNWIYNAKSRKRYRKKGNEWLIERTQFRGQWGITQDDQGRLYYNTNSDNLQGDFFSPGFGANNEHQQRVAGFSENIIKDNRVYPIRPTTGVNRGYMEGILDDSLRLVDFTAACGPVIYNSTLFGKEFYGNAFVAEPSANLIKRNILTNSGYSVSGNQAYTGHEFLASEDERFRPVNLFNGPDGALYIVDMYRGIIQHKTYLTPYLKNEIKERALTNPISFGRIYKVLPNGRKRDIISIPDEPGKLLKLLANPHGWVRNKAQQMIIDGNYKQLNAPLRRVVKISDQPLAIVHALWTMEGLGVLLKDDVLPLLNHPDWTLRMQALALSPSVIRKDNYREFLTVFREMISRKDTLAAPYIAFLASALQTFDPLSSKQLLITLSIEDPDNIFLADAVISNLQNQEAAFYNEFISVRSDTSLMINRRLRKIVNEMAKKRADPVKLAKDFPKGAVLYQSVCQICHGADGNGIYGLSPPLNNSEWVTGDKNKLIAIVLYGLIGPVKIGEKVYKAPEINGEMPGVGTNKDFSDEEISELLSFIRKSWSNQAEQVNGNDVTGMRTRFKDRQKSFTVEELNNLR